MPKNPCLTNNGGCDANATCKADGSFVTQKVWAVCSCKPGYSGDGKAGHCSAIDSCVTNNGGCDTNATCTSTGPGTNTCACNTGYTAYSGDGKTCCPSEKANWLLSANSPTYNLTSGVATDTRTGLRWQRVISTTGSANLADAKTYCANLNLEGLTWRVPTYMELNSVVDWTKYEPSIDTTVFSNTPSSGYFYTSTLKSGDPERMTVLSVTYGITGEDSSTAPYSHWYVRCVNDSNIVPVCGYNVKYDVVYDKATHLLWQRGVAPSTYPNATAASYCSTVSLMGIDSGWRVPTATEVQSLVDNRFVNPAIDTAAFTPNKYDKYYCSSTFDHYGNYFGVYFSPTPPPYGDGTYYLKCVHDVQ